MGYARTKGAGLPATRAGLAKVWTLSPSEKQYPVAWDGAMFAGQTVPAGTVLQTTFWDAVYDMADHPTHTLDVVYEDAGSTYRVIDIHATVAGYRVPVPGNLIGRPVSVLDRSAGMSVHSEMVDGGGILVTTSVGFGRAILRPV